MAEFICRLGTPAGEVVTRTVEAPGVHEARARLEREGFRVFNVTPPKTSAVTALTRLGQPGSHPRVKPNDFLLFNHQLAALIRAGIPSFKRLPCCANGQPRRAFAPSWVTSRNRFV